MEDKNPFGCGRLFLLGCAGLLVVMVLSGIMDGVDRALSGIHWFLGIFLCIGFIYLISLLIN